MNEQTKIKSGGFSVVEMAVVVFIIALLSTLIVVNYQQAKVKYNLVQAAQRMASHISRIQNLALTGRVQGTAIPTGYGIYIASVNQYKIFYNDSSVPMPFGDKYKKSGSVGSIDIETITLSSGVTLDAGSVGHCVFFAPPDPTTYIDGNNPSSPITFTLCPTNCSCPGGCVNKKTIRVDISGRINIQ